MLELIPGKHYEPIGEYDNEQEKIDNLTYLCHYMGGFEHTVVLPFMPTNLLGEWSINCNDRKKTKTIPTSEGGG